MSTNRERVLDFLASNGPSRPATIYNALGIKKNTAGRLYREMMKVDQLAKTEDGTLMLGQKTLSNPSPIASPKLPQAAVRRDKNIPVWNAGIEYDQNGGELRTTPRAIESPAATVTPDEQEMFDQFGMDSQEWTILTLRRSSWQSATGDWLEAYRATFAKRKGAQLAPMTEVELNDILFAYATRSSVFPQLRSERSDGSVRLIAMGDTQLGKPDGGGTKATVERFYNIIEQAAADLADGVDSLILPWLGDCLEGVVSQGGRNVARLDISITEQVRIYRRLFLHQVATLAPLARRVIIPVVGGNHDEAFRDQTQSPNDSWAIEGASAVADALVLADKFSHVQFLFPDQDRWGVTLNVGSEESPYVIHFEHGHQARNQTKVIDWWKGQTHGRQPAGAADMLMTAHWHNFQIHSTGGDRWWMQTPSMDGGSDWFRDKSGEDSAPGVLAFDVVGGASGWSNLKLYRG